MNFLDLKDISERYMELINPSSPEKIVAVGRYAGLQPGQRVIDFGSGFGEALALWADYFGISGVGIDIRPYACKRAEHKLNERGVADRVEIVCANAAEYVFEPHHYDLAACIGATFIWGGFVEAIQAMKVAVRPGGRLAIGEAHWARQPVPPEFARTQESMHTEYELLQLARQEGFDFEYMVRASHDDWDHYEASNWYGLVRWIEANPDHPERQQVIDHLHASQEEYLRYAHEYFGWAIYVLGPSS
jgi:SAM-dependent methyltransferase